MFLGPCDARHVWLSALQYNDPGAQVPLAPNQRQYERHLGEPVSLSSRQHMQHESRQKVGIWCVPGWRQLWNEAEKKKK